MGPLRVALLNPCFWPEVRRGSERFAHELATGLLARGHHPRVVTSHPGRPARGVEGGIPVTFHWRPPEGPLARRGYERYLTHVPFSYLSLRTGRYDVAQALFVTDAIAAGRWSRRTGKPSVFSYMGIPDRPGLVEPRGRLRLTRLAVRECTAVTALSHVAARAFKANLGVDATVINPGIDLSAFSPAARRAERPTIVFAADVTEPRKRAKLLVEAFRLVRRDRPDARLVFSRPSDPAAARSVAASFPEVELADLDRRDALARAYGEAWVSALPSVGEAFGLVLAEALACGTPAVGSDSGGLPEVVDREEVGRVFGGDRPEDLARALLEAFELASDPGTKDACRRRAEEFSLERCVERHLALYRELGA